MHRECGFIRLKPDTNKVAFVSAQNTGMEPLTQGLLISATEISSVTSNAFLLWRVLQGQ